jgi:thiamine biosynthesis protein ThiI
MYIKYLENDEGNIIDILTKIPGIIGISISYIVKTNIEDIEKKALEIISNTSLKTFKIETKRIYKSFEYDSRDINKRVGAYVLDNMNIIVDVHNPEIELTIEIRDNINTYIYYNEYRGLGGYPVGSNGRGLLMLSGGIDSPVAGYMALKRGVAIDAIYFESMPHTSLEARNKVINLCKILNKYSYDINLYIVPFTFIQESIYKNVDKSYVITIMRRMMYRITESVANSIDTKMIINGESIGQVSSQTLTNMYVINNVTNMPIIRPLACLDKVDIIPIAIDIGTYDISILPYEDCCTIFVPTHPVLNPTLDKCIELESNIDYINMIDKCIKDIKVINISKYDTFKDLL